MGGLAALALGTGGAGFLGRDVDDGVADGDGTGGA